ncbi:MAG: hypothetical protein IJL76_01620 [Bacilli bacterium]|nr:hypothetical protein [Bacilli bacterium]
MELKELISETDEMLKHFIYALGFNGDEYVDSKKCPIMYGNSFAPGEFFTAGSKRLENRLNKTKLDEDKKKKILDSGLIVVDKRLKDKKPDANLFVTLIHERLHASRMILINSNNRENEDINEMFFDGDKFVPTNSLTGERYVDPQQDIILGSIDTSKQAISKYESLTPEEKDDLSLDDYMYDEKLSQQIAIDEALVETMAIIAYKSYRDGNDDLMETVEFLNKQDAGEDIHAITNIILRHGDLDLFRWMAFPLEYQENDIHYDYFNHYVDEADKEDVLSITNSEELGFNDDLIESMRGNTI